MERGVAYLFDFWEIELKGGVDPSQNLRSANEVSRIHDPNVGRHFLWLVLCFSNSLPSSLSFSCAYTPWLLTAIWTQDEKRWNLKGGKSGCFTNLKSERGWTLVWACVCGWAFGSHRNVTSFFSLGACLSMKLSISEPPKKLVKAIHDQKIVYFSLF